MYLYPLLELAGVLTVLAVISYILVMSIQARRRQGQKFTYSTSRKQYLLTAAAAFMGLTMVGIGIQYYPIHSAVPPMMHSMTPDGNPPSLPLASGIDFILKSRNFEQVKDIGAKPNDVPAPITRTGNKAVTFNLTAREVIAEVSPGVNNNYWTYNGQVPGPMMRVKVGDDVTVNLTNDKTSLHAHNIDLHAVNGPGGGAAATKVEPGETRSFQWKAMNPGLYIYHCAMSNVSVHNSHGQYGLILVEPKKQLPRVDREFYMVQGELYSHGDLGRKGMLVFDPQALLDAKPTYITFNGRVESTPRMNAKVGETIRIYVGNGGVNLISSFHVIGEIFNTVYPEAAIGSAPHKNVQTTAVLPGGATIVEFRLEAPGSYLLVDHALARMNRGAWAVLKVDGAQNPKVFKPLSPGSSEGSAQASH